MFDLTRLFFVVSNKELEALNNGKPFADALMEVYGTALNFDYYAGWADKITGKILAHL